MEESPAVGDATDETDYFRFADKPGVGLLWFTLQRLANRDQENGTLAFCVRGKEVNYIVVEEG